MDAGSRVTTAQMRTNVIIIRYITGAYIALSNNMIKALDIQWHKKRYLLCQMTFILQIVDGETLC